MDIALQTPDGDDTPRKLVRAAQYVRMSTEHQQYSTENQADILREYAAKRGYEIVRTYADDGKSGLKMEGRASLRGMIDDVQAGSANFEAILVYDVSRWGRFQDTVSVAAKMGASFAARGGQSARDGIAAKRGPGGRLSPQWLEEWRRGD